MSLEEMQRELLTSDVTGLPNRRAFDEAEVALAVAMCDVDGLKALNNYGYETGNALLRAMADALCEVGLEAYHDKGDEFLCRDNQIEASRKPIPLDAGLADVLLGWRGRTAYAGQGDWLFASPRMNGAKPYSPDTILSKAIRPAAKRAGITKRIGWHTFRLTFATLLKANGEDVKVVQESLRHANSRITSDTYTQAVTPAKREAQSKVVRMIRPTGGVAATEVGA